MPLLAVGHAEVFEGAIGEGFEFEFTTRKMPLELNAPARNRRDVRRSWFAGFDRLQDLKRSPERLPRGRATAIPIPVVGKASQFRQVLQRREEPRTGIRRDRAQLGGRDEGREFDRILGVGKRATQDTSLLPHLACIDGEVTSVKPRTTHSRPRSRQDRMPGKSGDWGRPRAVSVSCRTSARSACRIAGWRKMWSLPWSLGIRYRTWKVTPSGAGRNVAVRADATYGTTFGMSAGVSHPEPRSMWFTYVTSHCRTTGSFISC